MALSTILRDATTYGNHPFVAKDTPVFVKAGRKKPHYNVLPGQLVAYLTNRDGTIPLAISPAEVTASNVHRLRIGVGHAPNGTTVTDIRYIGVEEAGNCHPEHMSVASPKCGSPMVVDYFFNCVSCYDNYTLSVGVDDNFTRSHSPLQKSSLEFFGGYQPSCAKCDDCDTPITCDEVVTGVVNSLRSDKAPTVQGIPYPDYTAPDVELPFHVTKLHDRSLLYCMSFLEPASDCTTCDRVSAITEVTIGGTAYPLVGTVIPGAVTQTARVQLDSVVDQINDLFDTHLGEGKGSAYITGVGPSDCCPLQLHVNTEDATFAITDIDPTRDYSPYAAGETGEGRTCGIRVIAAPLTGTCECILTKEAATYSRLITINGLDGFVDGRMVVQQRMEMPGQFGLSIQHRELQQTRGGSGRTYGAGYSGATWSGAPRADSLIVQAPVAKCKEDYCTFYARSKWYFDNPGNNQEQFIRLDSRINVPSGDTVTTAAVSAMLAKWAEVAASCTDIPTLTCSPLQKACPPAQAPPVEE